MTLHHGVSLKLLTQPHKSVPRNPLIANVFYVCRMIERWGRGTLDMIKNCKEAGNPLPIFEEAGNVFSVTMPLKEPMRTIIYEKQEEDILNNLTRRQKEILTILKNGPLNRLQIIEKMKMIITDRVMQLELNKLKKQGLINSEGQARATIWFLIDK